MSKQLLKTYHITLLPVQNYFRHKCHFSRNVKENTKQMFSQGFSLFNVKYVSVIFFYK
jgi:hypothetical protein